MNRGLVNHTQQYAIIYGVLYKWVNEMAPSLCRQVISCTGIHLVLQAYSGFSIRMTKLRHLHLIYILRTEIVC